MRCTHPCLPSCLLTRQYQACSRSLHMRQPQALHCASCATGLVLAAELNRSVVLPDFLLDGYQPDAKEWITVDKAQVEPFG